MNQDSNDSKFFRQQGKANACVKATVQRSSAAWLFFAGKRKRWIWSSRAAQRLEIVFASKEHFNFDFSYTTESEKINT
jgi:hypothetical protein